MFVFVFAVLSVPGSLVYACLEKRTGLLALLCFVCRFPIWGLGPDVVYDSIDSRSLPYYLLCNTLIYVWCPETAEIRCSIPGMPHISETRCER